MLADEADKINLPVFVVGGFVRDLLLNYPSLDFDIVVEGDAIYFAKRLAERYGGRVLTHQRFSTAKWHIQSIQDQLIQELGVDKAADATQLPDSLDLITARTEFYEQPAALPTVESSSIKMDLHRRDFTINTLALRLDGEHLGKIYDYWGGLSDLQKGSIRVLHALSFVDDATRLLRAVRFEQRFDFRIETRTLALMEESLPLIHKLTGARLRHEINLIMAEPKASAMLSRLAELDILKAIHSGLPWDETIQQQLSELNIDQIGPSWNLPNQADRLTLLQTLSYLVWLGQLPEPTLRSIVSRLRFKGDMNKLLISTSKLSRVLPNLKQAKPSVIVQELDQAPRLAIYAACLVIPDENIHNFVKKYIDQWAKVEPLTTGDDLRGMGLPPSPAIGQILKALRDAWLDEEIHSPEEEQVYLNRLLSELE
jgi:tRNA nucleotidyltransferase (CCA-adding enzyme)